MTEPQDYEDTGRAGLDSGTPPQDTGPPDQVETDPAGLNSSEVLDEDRIGMDPLEKGVEPPEHWSGAASYGTTPREEHQGETLDQRIRQEEPDVLDREDGAAGDGGGEDG